MSATPPPNAKAQDSQRKWLFWLIGIAALLIVFFWLRGRGKAPATVATDTTQTMVAPAPAPADTATAAEAAPTPTSTAPAPSPAAAAPAPSATKPAPAPVSRADTTRQVGEYHPPPKPGAGAMGGRGAPGKKPDSAPPQPR